MTKMHHNHTFRNIPPGNSVRKTVRGVYVGHAMPTFGLRAQPKPACGVAARHIYPFPKTSYLGISQKFHLNLMVNYRRVRSLSRRAHTGLLVDAASYTSASTSSQFPGSFSTVFFAFLRTKIIVAFRLAGGRRLSPAATSFSHSCKSFGSRRVIRTSSGLSVIRSSIAIKLLPDTIIHYLTYGVNWCIMTPDSRDRHYGGLLL